MSESVHAVTARQLLTAARAELYLAAQATIGKPLPQLEGAARHTDEALTLLDVHGVDVRPGVPDDFPRL